MTAGGNAPVIAAVITAAVAVVVAIGTQVWTSLAARTDRRYTARRAAIIDAQDAALVLRDSLDVYGREVRALAASTAAESAAPFVSPDTASDAARLQATGRFEVCRSRVHDPHIWQAMASWQTAASRRFLSVDDVSAGTEDEWFAYVQALCRIALMSANGSTTEKARTATPAPKALPD